MPVVVAFIAFVFLQVWYFCGINPYLHRENTSFWLPFRAMGEPLHATRMRWLIPSANKQP